MRDRTSVSIFRAWHKLTFCIPFPGDYPQVQAAVELPPAPAVQLRANPICG